MFNAKSVLDVMKALVIVYTLYEVFVENSVAPKSALLNEVLSMVSLKVTLMFPAGAFVAAVRVLEDDIVGAVTSTEYCL